MVYKEKTSTLRRGEYRTVRTATMLEGSFKITKLELVTNSGGIENRTKLAIASSGATAESIKADSLIENRVNSQVKSARARYTVNGIIGSVAGIVGMIGAVIVGVCGVGDLCLADTNTLPTKITTSNDRLQAMLEASDDFRFSMHALAQTLYPTAATTTP